MEFLVYSHFLSCSTSHCIGSSGLMMTSSASKQFRAPATGVPCTYSESYILNDKTMS